MHTDRREIGDDELCCIASCVHEVESVVPLATPTTTATSSPRAAAAARWTLDVVVPAVAVLASDDEGRSDFWVVQRDAGE